jgi:hypothetical protein
MPEEAGIMAATRDFIKIQGRCMLTGMPVANGCRTDFVLLSVTGFELLAYATAPDTDYYAFLHLEETI